MAGATLWKGYKTPNDIIDLCNIAEKMADDPLIGYTISREDGGGPNDTNCQTFVNDVTRDWGASAPEMYRGDTGEINGWKVYTNGSQPGQSRAKYWPGDVLAKNGEHTSIVVDWSGTTAEALNSGPAPNADLNGLTYELDKLWVITKINTVVYEKKNNGTGYEISSTDETTSSAIPSEFYQLDKPANSLADTRDSGWSDNPVHWQYHSAIPGTYWKYNKGWVEIDYQEYLECIRKGIRTKYEEGQAAYTDYWYQKTITKYYGFKYKSGVDGYTGEKIFAAMPGDQDGSEVKTTPGGVNSYNWDFVGRHIKSWVGIQYFSPNGVGKVYKIP